jgi:polar amino acid transport system substrate-binding protein
MIFSKKFPGALSTLSVCWLTGVLMGLLLCLPYGNSHAAAATIPLLSQYEYPPYLVSEGKGLTHDLASYLSKASHGKYQFVVQILPKKRLSLMISDGNWQGLVPWVMPEWVQDPQQRRYHWSGVILEDGDRVLSLPGRAIEWQGASSLYGLTLGGVFGHVYVDIEAEIAAGKIRRDDAPSMLSNIQKLQAGRVDAIFIPELLYRYLAQQDKQFSKDTYVSKTWVSPRRNQLRIMSGLGDPVLATWLEQQVQRMKIDAEWQRILNQYALSKSNSNRAGIN